MEVGKNTRTTAASTVITIKIPMTTHSIAVKPGPLVFDLNANMMNALTTSVNRNHHVSSIPVHDSLNVTCAKAGPVEKPWSPTREATEADIVVFRHRGMIQARISITATAVLTFVIRQAG